MHLIHGLKSTFLGLHWQSNKLIQEIKCSASGQILLEQPLCHWPAAKQHLYELENNNKELNCLEHDGVDYEEC